MKEELPDGIVLTPHGLTSCVLMGAPEIKLETLMTKMVTGSTGLLSGSDGDPTVRNASLSVKSETDTVSVVVVIE